ncbi:hypothetical protein NMY22_g15512 [Coprinellus aureogranulatus]|nr:hypothetical protein NMY22_g15512 [Coprinellus aureogranulatus]
MYLERMSTRAMVVPLRSQILEDKYFQSLLAPNVYRGIPHFELLRYISKCSPTTQAQKGTKPPAVFHFVPFIGSALAYSINPTNFLASCQELYGVVFTFTLFGKRVTFIQMEDAEELIEAQCIAPDSLFADTGDAYLVRVLRP